MGAGGMSENDQGCPGGNYNWVEKHDVKSGNRVRLNDAKLYKEKAHYCCQPHPYI